MQLTTDERGSGFVPDGVEEAIDGKVFFFTCEYVLDAEIVEKVTISLALGSNRVPKNGLDRTQKARRINQRHGQYSFTTSLK